MRMCRPVAAAAAALTLTIFPAAASAGPVRVNALNASEAWVPTNTPGAVDLSPGLDCPFRYGGTNGFPLEYSCQTEYYFTSPSGRRGSRIFSASGYVKWHGVHVNPIGPGLLGYPTGYFYTTQVSWIRHWQRDRCRGIKGLVFSNIPCERVVGAMYGGNPRRGGEPRNSKDPWPWLDSFPCVKRGDWTACRNGDGDEYRYHGKDPYPKPKSTPRP